MDNRHNKENLARLAAILPFFHIWIALAYIWYQAWRVGFFGDGGVGWIVAGITLLLMVLPVVPGAISRFVILSLTQAILEREIVSNWGCLAGIITFVGAVLFTIWGLSRDPWLALKVFLLAPVIALVIALIATYIKRLRWR